MGTSRADIGNQPRRVIVTGADVAWKVAMEFAALGSMRANCQFPDRPVNPVYINIAEQITGGVTLP